MLTAIWIDRDEQVAALARILETHGSIGLDTEFLRERTFFPKLCLLQLAAAGEVWCVDTLRCGSLEPLVPALARGSARKVIHSARQDLEAFYLNVRHVISPVFDTQIAAGCVGLKPQLGYADLVRTLLDVTVPKGQTRTDWSKRPLTPAQLEYATDDVAYLNEAAERLTERLRALGREAWVLEDCRMLEDPALYEPDPEQAWKRLRNLRQLEPAMRARAKVLAVWRERTARERNLPRGWIVPDEALFRTAAELPANAAALAASLSPQRPMPHALAQELLGALRESSTGEALDEPPSSDSRPTPEQKRVMERLAALIDAHAAALGISAEILATRGELKALAMGDRHAPVLTGWRRAEIGDRLLEALG
ncbi:MAG TPA: ribonuclease D [Steroidobacteraceae bacterium]|nr:ribonuclease D [Steroidobacteraceae bacterium]